VGRARLIVGRSSRAFELELSAGAWRVVRATSLAAPRAPSPWKRRKKEASMSQPDVDTTQSLADVEVELSIELARLEMPIAEVAALAPGVVVTTGRLVGERVAVRAGDRVIAWGELVDVEGEVGVRLTEVAARAE
jgi:flagellar motor switch protein FliN